MEKKDFLLILGVIITGAILTYWSINVNSVFLRDFTLIYWAITLANYTGIVFKYATGNRNWKTPKNSSSMAVSFVLLLINLAITYYLFVKSKWEFVILLIFLYISFERSVVIARANYLERNGKKASALENIKSSMVAETWFLLLLCTLKCARLFMRS